MMERQEKLLEFLKAGDPGRYISKEEICNSLPELYPRYEENSTEHNSTTYSNIRKDIKQLRESYKNSVVIISNKNGYKLASNSEEKEEYLNRYLAKTLRMLKRYWKITNKAADNYQLKFDEQGNVKLVEVYSDQNH